MWLGRLSLPWVLIGEGMFILGSPFVAEMNFYNYGLSNASPMSLGFGRVLRVHSERD